MLASHHLSATGDEADRVRRATSPAVNDEIDRRTQQNIRHFSGLDRQDILRRIDALEREWDIERVLEVNASTLALTGLVLGLTVNRRWFMLPGVVLPFLLQHGLQAGVRRCRSCAAWACAPGARSTGRSSRCWKLCGATAMLRDVQRSDANIGDCANASTK